jgi:hypothetical protein
MPIDDLIAIITDDRTDTDGASKNILVYWDAIFASDHKPYRQPS